MNSHCMCCVCVCVCVCAQGPVCVCYLLLNHINNFFLSMLFLLLLPLFQLLFIYKQQWFVREMGRDNIYITLIGNICELANSQRYYRILCDLLPTLLLQTQLPVLEIVSCFQTFQILNLDTVSSLFVNGQINNDTLSLNY